MTPRRSNPSHPTSPSPPAPVPSGSRRRALGIALLTLGALVIATLLAVGGAIGGLRIWGDRKTGAPARVEFEIPRGASLQSIAHRLTDRGVVDRPQWFMAYAWLIGKHRSLQAGEYHLDLPLSPREVIEQLQNGRFERRLTIPEGWTRRQTAEQLLRDGWIPSPEVWIDLVNRPLDATLLGFALPGGTEGFCFPDTYFLEKDTPAEEIHRRMLARFEQVWTELKPGERSPRSASLTPLEIVTLASMIEREARSHDELPAIASVYLNRLAIRMRLQCCATVHYALGEVWDRPLLHEDLKIDSPYNTYLHYGLPPGPIGNPGREALAAVLHPADNDFLYYVYRGDGTHEFTKTYREHMAAARRFRDVDPNAALMKARENGRNGSGPAS